MSETDARRFGSLLMVGRVLDYALTECDCGRSKVTRYRHMVAGRARSCGCSRKKRHLSSDDVNAFLRKNVRVDPHSGCHLWIHDRDIGPNGYARVCFGKRYSAHRLAVFGRDGVWPSAGSLVCHTCDVRRCCNPDHLVIADHSWNMADRNLKGRQASGERHWSRLTPSRLPRGEANGMTKLSVLDKDNIAVLRVGGWSLRQLAETYGVHVATVSGVLRSRSIRIRVKGEK